MSRTIRTRNGGKRGTIDTVIVDLETEIDNISIFELDKMADGEKKNLINDLQTLVKLYELRGPVGREGATETMYKASLILQKLQTDKKMKTNWDMRSMLASMGNMGAPVINQVVQQVAPAAPVQQGAPNADGQKGEGKSDDDQLESTFRNMIIDLGSEGVDLYINEDIMVMGNEGVWGKLKTKMEVAVKLPNAVPDVNKLNAVLVYGPPGTGKTAYARQLAALRINGMENAKFMSVAASAVESKYHGESARNVRALWKVARESVEYEPKGDYKGRLVRPVVIFFDEFDALFSGGDHSKPVQNEFLTQMEGLLSKNRGIFFMAATNSFAKIPSNVMNRFSETIWLGLPGLLENTSAKTVRDLFTYDYANGYWELSKIIESTILRYEAPNTFYRSYDPNGDVPDWVDKTSENALALGQKLANVVLAKDNGHIEPIENTSDTNSEPTQFRVIDQHTTINARSVNNTIVNILWVKNLEAAFTRLKSLSGEPSFPWILDDRERYEVNKDGQVVSFKKARLICVPVDRINSPDPAQELMDRLKDTYRDANQFRRGAMFPISASEQDRIAGMNNWMNEQNANIRVVYPIIVNGQTSIDGQIYSDDDIAAMLMPEPISASQLEEILMPTAKTYKMSELSTFSKKFAEFKEAEDDKN
uniref:AAA+ ATPase spastin n=1 Tax=Clandestinovirus TaxID=2831644 RepID=A0A8F8KRE4_9VIRU|nr:AAA+ ATPase spastin [Clandestinovirus]